MLPVVNVSVYRLNPEMFLVLELALVLRNIVWKKESWNQNVTRISHFPLMDCQKDSWLSFLVLMHEGLTPGL